MNARARAPRTVLVVDDDPAILDALSEFLEGEGFAVVTAQDGRAALDHLSRGLRPCVILLDLMMPRMDGWGFRHEQLKADELKDIRVVVITATGFSEASVRAQFGDIELLAKPPSPEALIHAVRCHCGEAIHERA